MLYDPDKIISEVKEDYFKNLKNSAMNSESVKIVESQNRVLAEHVKADHCVPPFVRSLVDGYAVGSADTAFIDEDGPATLTVAGSVEMGKVPTSLPRVMTAFTVPTGGMLPDGADCAVRIEDTKELPDGKVEVLVSVQTGENIELDGTEVANKSVVLKKGKLIGPEDMATLAEFGHVSVSVMKKPVVHIFSSGDELTAIDQPLEHGKIRDTNLYMLAGMVSSSGGEPVIGKILADNLDVVVNEIKDALKTADLVIMTGGTAVGGKDFTAEAFGKVGAPGVVVNGVKVKGGRPIVLANADGKPVIGLAGYPPGAKSGFEMIAGPLIQNLLGVSRT